jgi:Rieske Fe-S protein
MTETTRRAVLAGAVGVGTAAVVAGCGGGGDKGSSATGGAQPRPTPASTGQAGKALARTADIPLHGGKVFEAEKVVVTQPSAGHIKAFSAVCTHMGCLVGSVANDVITCPCHGSTYSAQDGSVTRGPAPKPLAAKQLTVTGDSISVSG